MALSAIPKETRQVVFISNPFGFGPTGRVVAIIEDLTCAWDGQIVFAAGKKCQGILPDHLKKRVLVVDINERDEDQLVDLFEKYPPTLVVVNLNKIAAKVAASLKLRMFFIDSLAWMWKNIPKEYLRANTYYYYNIFGASTRLAGIPNAKPVAPVLGNLPEVQTNRSNKIVAHIGGFSNPLVPGFSKNYLELFAGALDTMNDDVLVAGGNEAIKFLSRKIKPSRNISLKTMDRDAFLRSVSRATRLVTTPGSTAVLESFAVKTPVAFLPPTNLSQWRQLNLFFKAGAAPLETKWEDYVTPEWDFNELDEKEAVPKFDLLSKRVLDDPKLKNFVIKKMSNLFVAKFSSRGQAKFIREVGRNGSEVIVADILKVLM